MDLLFLCQFLLSTIGLILGGVLFAVGLCSFTIEGRNDLRKLYNKWRFRRTLKKKFESDEWGHMIDYAERDVQMVLALHKHIVKPHPTLYDQVAWDHGFYPHEDNDTETE